MARASYRRRPDGVLEIVRPHPLARMGRRLKLKTAAMAALVVALTGASAGLFVLFGVPFIVLAGCAAFAAVLWRMGQPKKTPAPVRGVGVRRQAT